MYCSEQIIDIENVDQDDQQQVQQQETLITRTFDNINNTAASAMLPPSTRPYTLVLDLDETLIHSHVQYKQKIETRAQ